MELATLEIIIRTDRANRNIRQTEDGLKRIERQGRRTQRAVDGNRTALNRFSKTGTAATAAVAGGMQGLRRALLGVQSVLLALGVGLGFTQIIRTLADFEFTLAGVRAVAQATDEEFQDLTATARELGATTIFTATQAGQGLRLLALAGFEVDEALGASEGTLALATAGTLSLADASRITANIIRAFRKEASEAGAVADVLAKAATNANTTVLGLGDSFSFVGSVARAANQSVADTAAAIGVLGDAGFDASRAGTGLRRVLAEILKESDKITDRLPELGLTFADIDLRTNSLVDVFDRLRPLATDAAFALEAFGQRGGPAFLALVSQADRLRDLADETRNAGGTAQDIADILTDTLTGSLKLLRSALEEAILQIGDAGFTGKLRGLADTIRGTISALTGMLDPTDENAAAYEAAAERVRIFGVALLSIGVVAAIKGLTALALAFGRLSKTILISPLGRLTLGIAVAAAALFALRKETIRYGDDVATVGGVASRVFENITLAIGDTIREIRALSGASEDLGTDEELFDFKTPALAAAAFGDAVLNVLGAIGAAIGVTAGFIVSSFRNSFDDVKVFLGDLATSARLLGEGEFKAAGEAFAEAFDDDGRTERNRDLGAQFVKDLVDGVQAEFGKNRIAEIVDKSFKQAAEDAKVTPTLDTNEFRKQTRTFVSSLAGLEGATKGLDGILESLERRDISGPFAEQFEDLRFDAMNASQGVKDLVAEVERLGGLEGVRSLSLEEFKGLQDRFAALKAEVGTSTDLLVTFGEKLQEQAARVSGVQEVINGLEAELRVLAATSELEAEVLANLEQAEIKVGDRASEAAGKIRGLTAAVLDARRRQELLLEVLDASITPADRLGEQVRDLQFLFNAGAITVDQYSAALKRYEFAAMEATQAQAELDEKIRQSGLNDVQAAFANAADGLNNVRDATKEVVAEISGELSGALTDVLFEGKDFVDALGSAFLNLAKRITEAAFEALVLKPILASLGGASASSAGGVVGLVAGLFAQGGRATAPPAMGVVPASLFSNPSRFQMGGTGDRIPALINRNEAVVPLPGGRAIPVEMGEDGESQRPIVVNINGVTDFESFRRSQSQVAAGIRAAVEGGARNS